MTRPAVPTVTVADPLHSALTRIEPRAGVSARLRNRGAWPRIPATYTSGVNTAVHGARDAVRQLLILLPTPDQGR